MSRGREAVIEIRRRRLGGEENEPQLPLPPPLLEIAPAFMPHDANLVEIIHSGAPEGAVRDREPGGFHDMRLDAEAGAEPENRSGILRDVGLEKGDPHGVGVEVSAAWNCPAFGAWQNRTVLKP